MIPNKGRSEVGVASEVMSRVPPPLLVPLIAWQYRFFEPELGRLDEIVQRHRGAVDVGVWWGPWSWWLARKFSTVDSFEPNLDLVSRLAPVLPGNVTIHPVALSDRSGESSLWVPSGGMGTEGRASLEPGRGPECDWTQRPVTTRRLDDFDLGEVDFVKIDVEGHELAVLLGATNLLREQRPAVLVEIEQHPERQGHLDSIIEFFNDHDYRGSFLMKGRWNPIEELDRIYMRSMADRVAHLGYATNLLLYSRRYVHNFVFEPREVPLRRPTAVRRKEHQPLGENHRDDGCRRTGAHAVVAVPSPGKVSGRARPDIPAHSPPLDPVGNQP